MGEQLIAFLSAAGIKLGVLMSATVGGFMSLRFFEGDKLSDGTVKPLSVSEKWTIAVSGSAMGVFLSGFLLDLFDVPDKTGRVETGFALLIALFGMASAASIIKAIREADIKGVIESWTKRR